MTSHEPHSSLPAWRRLLFSSDATFGPWIARLTLAGVMFPHGAQKVLGWWGGYGFGGTYDFFTSKLGLPAPVAVFTILLEFVGPLLLVVGFLSRAVAAGFVGIMLGAITKVHQEHGFFMNWYGAQKGEGFEYHLLVIGLALVVLVAGSGRFGLDRRFARL